MLAILLGFALLCGSQLLRSLGVRELSVLACAGLALAIAAHLTILNASLRLGLELTGAHICSFLLIGTFGIASVLWKLSKPVRVTTLWEMGLILLATLVTWVSTNASQLGLSDQDFWIHTPLQRFMLDGQFPPQNPYFPELELHGHYGRDLLIVSTSWVSGWDTFRSQMMVTSFCQSLALLVLYFGLRELTGSKLQAALASGFVYLGTNTAYRAGWIDEFVSHSPLSHLHWTVLVLTFGLWFKQQNWKTTVLFGLILGSHGLVFTTTFGTGMVASFLAVLALRRFKRAFKRLALVLSLAVLLAGFQGGAISDLFQSALGFERTETQALRNQSQSVMVRFPKTHVLSIAKHDADRSHSSIYNYFPAKALFSVIDHDGVRYTEKYAPLWSWDFLKLHWLGVFLAPLTGYWLFRKRHSVGVFCWIFGLVSFLTPGLLDFGPVQENDWFRWVIWTGSGFAVAFGLALASWFEESRRKIPARVILILLIWLNTLAGVHYLVFNVPENIRIQGGILRVTTLDVTTDEWMLQYGPFLELHPVDLRAFQWLRDQKVVGQNVLVNFDPSRVWGIQFESALSGYTGLRCLGHQLPLDQDRIGQPPVRMTPLAHSLLHYGNERSLRSLAPDWLYLRLNSRDEAQELLKLPGLQVGYQEVGEDGRIRMVIQVSPEEK